METIMRIVCGTLAMIPYLWLLADNVKSVYDIAIIILIIVFFIIWLFLICYAISGNKFLRLFKRSRVQQKDSAKRSV